MFPGVYPLVLLQTDAWQWIFLSSCSWLTLPIKWFANDHLPMKTFQTRVYGRLCLSLKRNYSAVHCSLPCKWSPGNENCPQLMYLADFAYHWREKLYGWQIWTFADKSSLDIIKAPRDKSFADKKISQHKMSWQNLLCWQLDCQSKVCVCVCPCVCVCVHVCLHACV